VVKLVDGDAQQVTLRDGGCVVGVEEMGLQLCFGGAANEAACSASARDSPGYLRVEGRAQLAGE
jgi:hypothetical protein